jgi:hypothetical protein
MTCSCSSKFDIWSSVELITPWLLLDLIAAVRVVLSGWICGVKA